MNHVDFFRSQNQSNHSRQKKTQLSASTAFLLLLLLLFFVLFLFLLPFFFFSFFFFFFLFFLPFLLFSSFFFFFFFLLFFFALSSFFFFLLLNWFLHHQIHFWCVCVCVCVKVLYHFCLEAIVVWCETAEILLSRQECNRYVRSCSSLCFMVMSDMTHGSSLVQHDLLQSEWKSVAALYGCRCVLL